MADRPGPGKDDRPLGVGRIVSGGIGKLSPVRDALAQPGETTPPSIVDCGIGERWRSVPSPQVQPWRRKAGTVLVREYRGERHTVSVVPDGFVWREASLPVWPS